MRRRHFLALAGAAAAFPRVALSQQATKVWRIAIVANSLTDAGRQAMSDGLSDLGYVEGRTISIQIFNAPTIATVAIYAAQAVASKPDVILTLRSEAPLALKALTTTIPVVMSGITDPVAIEAVASYAHPGGNMTGFMN